MSDVAVVQGSGSVDVRDAKAIMYNSCSTQIKRMKKSWVAVIGTSSNYNCNACDRMLSAYENGASAVIFYSKPGNQRGYPHSLPPSPGYCARKMKYKEAMSKIGSFRITRGIVSLSDSATYLLLQQMSEEAHLKVDLTVESKFELVMSRNVVAESVNGANDSIVMFGCHLDSGIFHSR
jgi:hypothetical protein